MNEILTPILAQLTRGVRARRPTRSTPRCGELFEGRVSDVQAAAFIVALRTKGETEERARRARAHDARASARRSRCADGAIDTCGTGGDRSGTFNVSTMAALVAAGAGARVVKHGNRAASSQARIGRRARGARRRDRARPGRRRACVEEAGVGFCFAPRYHPAMRFLGPARKRARRADHVQLPRSAREPGARPPPGGRRVRCRDGDAHARRARARSAPSARWCSSATTASTS